MRFLDKYFLAVLLLLVGLSICAWAIKNHDTVIFFAGLTVIILGLFEKKGVDSCAG
jgi:uncharacterized membrane protein HdeD (DUF308 family)